MTNKKHEMKNGLDIRLVAASTGLSAFLIANSIFGNDNAKIPQQETEDTICMPSGTQNFVFGKDGSGVNDAILAIKGSGNGESDPCWDEAKEAVEDALTKGGSYPNIPQTGQEISIPESLKPSRK